MEAQGFDGMELQHFYRTSGFLDEVRKIFKLHRSHTPLPKGLLNIENEERGKLTLEKRGKLSNILL